MSTRTLTPGDSDAQRLAIRLRDLADEIESAERAGLPVPFMVSANGHEFGRATWHIDEPTEFESWVAYTDARVEEYDLDGQHWRSGEAVVNGLPVHFATSAPIGQAAVA